MKFSKFCFMLAAATFAAGAFADAANVLVSFWSTDDYYADGSRVLPGEWYALCWSPNAEFGGITCDFEPAREGDIIFDVMPRAKVYPDGNVGCKFTVFQASASKVKAGGNYFVYLLDTRDATGKSVAKDTKVNSVGLCVPNVRLSGCSVSGSFTADVADNASTNKGVASDVAASDIGKWSESAVPAAILKQPRIVDFTLVEGAKVNISVADMIPGMKYNICMGNNPSELTTYRLQAPKISLSEDEIVPFTVSSENAKFFQVVRQPLGQQVVAEEE